MRKILFALALASLCSCSGGKSYTKFTQNDFKNPAPTFRSMPFHSLNDSLSADELSRQLKLMKDGGYGGSFLHSRTGLLTPYMGREWFDIMDAGVKTCEELGLEAWFYDEDKWPSGYAGGEVPRSNPAFRSHQLIRMPKDAVIEEPDKVLWEDENHKYVCYEERLGEAWYNGACWVDLMNPDMVKAFIDCTYKPYAERFSGNRTAKGIFSDEPQVKPRAVGLPGEQGKLSYSPSMEKAFKDLWGYDLDPVIPSLFERVGDWRTVRLHYYRTVAYCMEQAFSKQVGDYCRANGLKWIGHYNAEEGQSSNMQNEGNLMMQLRHMDVPGVDALGLKFKPLHNDRVMTSVANQYGKQRRVVEIFGISGHNLSFEDRMWLTAWHTQNGANMLCPHLALYSMKGERKRDYPPTLSYQQPYWSSNKLFEDFAARMCYFATCGKYEGEICVLATIESDYIGDRGADGALSRAMQTLTEKHFNYDIGDEQLIQDIGRTEGNRFIIGEMSYHTVIVPALATIRPNTLKLLKEFGNAGGRILVLNAYPQFVDGVENEEALNGLKEVSSPVSSRDLGEVLDECEREFTISGDNSSRIWSHLRRTRNGQTLQLSNTSRLNTYRASVRFAHPGRKTALMNPVNGDCLELTPDSDGAYTIEFEPAQSWILVNGDNSIFDRYDGAYTLPGERTTVASLPEVWQGARLDPNSLVLDFCEWSTDGGATWNGPEPPIAISNRCARKEECRYDGPMLLKFNFNVETVPSECKLAVEQPQMYNCIAVNGKPVSFSKDYFIDSFIRTADVSGLLREGENSILLSLDFKSAIRTSIDPVERYGTEIETIYLVGDFGVRGELAEEQPVSTWLSRNRNLQARPMPARYSYGSFSITGEDSAFSGDITRNGYPFYAGRFNLSSSFKFEGKKEGVAYKLAFPAFESVLLDIEFNGERLPSLFCHPWEADVTELLRDGDNNVTVTLTGSLRNLMGPSHNVGGEFSEVGPATFTGDNDWPNFSPGDKEWYDLRKEGQTKLWRDDYFCIPFGLTAAPIIIEETR